MRASEREAALRAMFNGSAAPPTAMRCALVSLVAVLATCPALQAQTQEGTSQTPPFRVAAEEVVLDAVVRDSKGRLVRDLRAEEVEVYEDGVRQTIRSFRLVSGQQAQAPQTPAEPELRARRAAVREPALLCLVFERLGLEGQRFSRRAATELADRLPAGTAVAVFVLDRRLYGIQTFTEDRDLIRQAIDRATAGLYSAYIRDTQRIIADIEDTKRRWGQFGIDRRLDEEARKGEDAATRKSRDMMLATLRFELQTVRYFEARASLEALLSLVREMGALSGRKTVLYIAEGLTVTRDLNDLKRSLISVANAAHVSFYCLDARGLQVRGTVSNEPDREWFGGLFGDNPAGENAANLMVSQQLSMAELAESTGGFLIANTNVIQKPLARLAEDIGTHYEISYAPSAQKFDARFRRTEVKVSRRGARVQARSGYYALPSLGFPIVHPFELDLLKALDASPPAHAFEFRSAAIRFGPADRAVEHVIIFELPVRGLAAQQEKNGTQALIDPAFMVLVKDARGQVIQKRSRDMPLRVPSDKLDEFRRGTYTYTERIDLEPGHYTLETAILDRLAGKASASRASLHVETPRLPALSQPVMIRRVEPATGPAAADPLEFGGKRVTPALAAPTGGLSVFFRVYPAEAREQPQAILEVFRAGSLLSRTAAEPVSSGDGSIAFAVPLPAAILGSGQCEVRVSVIQGGAATDELVVLP